MTAKPVVAGTDGSAASLRAVDWAAREAQLRKAPLRIVAAAAMLPRMMGSHGMSQYDTVADLMRRHRGQALAVAAARAAQVSRGLLIHADELTGDPAQAVAEAGSGAQLLVVGSRGLGAFTALLLGSVSRYAATHAPCPVVVVRDEARATRRQVGVGLGDLDDCADALTFAFEEAALRQVPLVAMHAWHAPQLDVSRAGLVDPISDRYPWPQLAAERLQDLLDSWRAKYPGVPVSQDVVPGHPGQALAGLSARADLTVLGRHATRRGVHGAGSVTHAVLNHAHGPVVTVPSSS